MKRSCNHSHLHYMFLYLSGVSFDCDCIYKYEDLFPRKKQAVNLFGRAEKLEKTYLAIISRHVSVSSR